MQNQVENFEPIHQAHAIEQVAFVIQFDRPLDPPKMVDARKAAEQFKDDLPGQAELQGFAMTIGGPGQVFPRSGANAGAVFNFTRPDGTVESELRVERLSISFRTIAYSRWEVVWGQAWKYLCAILPIYAEVASLAGIALNYVDKFKWLGDPTRAQPSLLLRPHSRYLAPHVYNAKDLWHSHTGLFLHADNFTKRLLNMNVDCSDQQLANESRRVISVATLVTDMFNQPGYDNIPPNATNAAKLVEQHMTEFHRLGKETLREVINDQMCKRIALTV